MAQAPLSFTVRKNTTSAEIACFLQQAGKKVCRPDAGLRARQGVGADGKHDGTVVLYVRDLSGSKTLGDRVALLVDDVKAFFKAKEEYRLAAVTLLERARFASRHEMEFQEGTKLCPSLARVLEGKGERLTIQDTHHAWQAAFTEKARMQSGAVLTALRKNTAGLKGLPDTRQKNGQAPGQVVEQGLSELFYLEALLSVSSDHLGGFERRHLIALSEHLGQPLTDESLFDLKDAITSLIHVACHRRENKPDPSGSFAANSAADVEHIKTSIEFAQTWINGCFTRPDRSDSLRYNHVLALDYFACMILMTYQPDSEGSGHARQLLTKISKKKPGDNYRSVTVALEGEFVDWLRLGRSAYAFFAGKQADMQSVVSEID